MGIIGKYIEVQPPEEVRSLDGRIRVTGRGTGWTRPSASRRPGKGHGFLPGRAWLRRDVLRSRSRRAWRGFPLGWGYHHHIGLYTWESAGGTPPPHGHTGLYHVAFLYPDGRALGDAVRQLLDHGHPIDGTEDHGATVSVYLRDPDGNGIELYLDRPRNEWFDKRGNPVLKAEPFDQRELLKA
jgi:catechol 2,3-dioxygenase-like lactoylglutathione lyase family enzyme